MESLLKSIRVLCLIAFYYDKSKFTNQHANKSILGTFNLAQKLRNEDLMQLSLLGLPQNSSEKTSRVHYVPFILGFHVAYLQLFLEDNSVPMYPASFIEQINKELKNDTAENFTTHSYGHKRKELIGEQKELLLNPVIKIPGVTEQDRKSFFNPLFQGVEWFIVLLYKFISQSDNLDQEQKTRLVKNLLTTIEKLSNIENKYAFFEVESFLSKNKEEATIQINPIPIIQPQESVKRVPTGVNIQKTDNVPKIQPKKPVAVIPKSGTIQFCLKTQQWISQTNSDSTPVANEDLHELPIIALLNQYGMFAPHQDANPVNEPPTKKFKSGPTD